MCAQLIRIHTNRANYFISCVNICFLGTKFLSNRYRHIVLQATVSSPSLYKGLFPGHFQRWETPCWAYKQYSLYSLRNQTIALEWWSEHNSNNMFLPLFHAIYNPAGDVGPPCWAYCLVLYSRQSVWPSVSEPLLEVQKYLGGANMKWGHPWEASNIPGLGAGLTCCLVREAGNVGKARKMWGHCCSWPFAVHPFCPHSSSTGQL